MTPAPDLLTDLEWFHALEFSPDDLDDGEEPSASAPASPGSPPGMAGPPPGQGKTEG